ncbi:MaoC/PaaZ C-terminal domain-containing protein [Desulfococcus sp.]|uniref:MaoC/PaaZ C-terminal domain-containing protein n=1 Tax=Desulfococcus sp. TaxID=2025834 RepID=UPI0035945C38
MALDLKAVGKPMGPFVKEYQWKDVVLYALGVGAGFPELEYCYEKRLKVIPTFAIAAVFDFFFRVAASSRANLAGILHGGQDLVFHHPIPVSGTLTTEGRITGYVDKGAARGALVTAESLTRHTSGQPLFTSRFTLFSRLDGGFGGEDAPAQTVAFPDRAPDIAAADRPSPDQPLIYRLSGDLFELHADPGFARTAGFERPIMHGLCTLGFACRALVHHLAPGAPEKVRRIACRFSKPLYPGVPIRTLIWSTGPGTALWKTVTADGGDEIITGGLFEYGR